MNKIKFSKLLMGLLLSSSIGITAQNFQTMQIQSGLSADVVANGVGSALLSTSIDVDGVSYAFVSRDFKLTSSSTALTYGLPTDGVVNSAVTTTPGLSYQLANYTGNNSLRLAATNDVGTIVFTTPKAATKLYMLSTSGSGTSTVNVVVNFTDGTTQAFNGVSVSDWFGGSNFAIQGFGRINRNTDTLEPNATDPRLYQTVHAIDAGNQTKLIQSVTVTKASGSGIPNVFAFSVDEYSTCNAPALQPVANITVNSADVSWTSVSNGVTYEVYHSTSNTTPTSATTPTYTGITGASKTISGLSSNTMYYYWVRTNCSGGSSPSYWSYVGSFKTLCSIFTTPYTENFDTTTTGSSSNTNAPSCWSYVESASFTGYGYVYASNPNSAPNSYYLNNSSATAGSQMLVSPPTTNLSNGSKRVRFYARAGGSGYTVSVGTMANATDTTTFTAIGSPISLTSTYTLYTVNIPSGTDMQLAFKHGLGGSFRSVYLDDITVEDIPSCFEPTSITSSNITSNSATIGWTSPSPAPSSGYEVYFSTSNTAPTSATVLNATNSVTSTGVSATVSSLSSASVYYVWVRSVCSISDKSAWSLSGTFATLCNATNLPYTMDFESVTTPALPICGTNVNNGSGNDWVTASSPGNGFTTKVLQYSYNSGSAADTWFFTQGVNLTAGTQYTISYNYGNNSSTYTEKLKVAYGMSATSTAMTNLIADYPSVNDGVLHSASVVFTPATTGVYYFGFYAYSDADQYKLYVDDISIVEGTLATSEVSVNRNEIRAYPNPFTDVLNISDVKNVKSVTVIDLSGRVVKTIEKPTSNLHLGDLKSGLFIVNLNLKDGTKQSIKAMKK